jgi:hypothetical protein
MAVYSYAPLTNIAIASNAFSFDVLDSLGSSVFGGLLGSNPAISRLLSSPATGSEVYNNNIAPHMKQGASLAFAHGFNVHYNQVVPREDLDVWMVAPKAPGHTVRNTYTQGGGVPHLVAIHQDTSALCDGLGNVLGQLLPASDVKERNLFFPLIRLTVLPATVHSEPKGCNCLTASGETKFGIAGAVSDEYHGVICH